MWCCHTVVWYTHFRIRISLIATRYHTVQSEFISSMARIYVLIFNLTHWHQIYFYLVINICLRMKYIFFALFCFCFGIIYKYVSEIWWMVSFRYHTLTLHPPSRSSLFTTIPEHSMIICWSANACVWWRVYKFCVRM